MGQIVVARAPERMKAILGSCVGVVLYHPVRKTAAMAHIVLPDSDGRDGAPGNFADSSISSMITLLAQQGAPVHDLTARFAGGADMFAGSGPLKIGDANVNAVVRALRDAGIRVAGQDVGGTHGRRIEFDCASGKMTVQSADQPAYTF
jgi:chemotaxis protein CheD